MTQLDEFTVDVADEVRSDLSIIAETLDRTAVANLTRKDIDGMSNEELASVVRRSVGTLGQRSRPEYLDRPTLVRFVFLARRCFQNTVA